jgi:AcrR family transcriptional regulator
MSDRSEPSGGPGADDAGSRIDQIADAALRLFARYGYKRSSMDDIAREAGLAKATLYLHFKGKDDVFRAMLQLLARRDETRCREVMAMNGPFATRLAALLHAHYGQAYASFGTGEHLVELKAVMASIAGPELQTFDQIFVEFAKRLFVKAAKAGEITPARSGVSLDPLIASLMLAAVGAKAGDPPSREIYAERLTSIAKIFAAAVAR